MSAQYSMKFGEVETVVGDLGKANNDIKQLLNQLENNVKQLIEHWSGDAVENYTVKQQDWTNACSKLDEALRTSGVALEHILDNTKLAERQAASVFGR
ncbi:WXG100 family type VII secretion target [Kitasatospora sp. NPDC059571]|uniref:WXG100 family type VII secretion target n=1 Tax=Kitasatospora sp. NPDC059571 TaxID=3346871 RepID=UPI0036982D31